MGQFQFPFRTICEVKDVILRMAMMSCLALTTVKRLSLSRAMIDDMIFIRFHLNKSKDATAFTRWSQIFVEARLVAKEHLSGLSEMLFATCCEETTVACCDETFQ